MRALVSDRAPAAGRIFSDASAVQTCAARTGIGAAAAAARRRRGAIRRNRNGVGSGTCSPRRCGRRWKAPASVCVPEGTVETLTYQARWRAFQRNTERESGRSLFPGGDTGRKTSGMRERERGVGRAVPARRSYRRARALGAGMLEDRASGARSRSGSHSRSRSRSRSRSGRGRGRGQVAVAVAVEVVPRLRAACGGATLGMSGRSIRSGRARGSGPLVPRHRDLLLRAGGGRTAPSAGFFSSSSIVRGQSSLRRRASDRSERIVPPVWQRGQ